MTDLELEQARLELQHKQIELEREKWKTEAAHREQQLANEVSELELRKADFDLRREEHKRAGWRNPLVVAILAATVAAIGNGVITVVNGSLQRTLEGQKSESARVLEMIKTAGDPDKAAENLNFLLDAGLVDNPIRVSKLRAFLEAREPGTGPSLLGASISPSIVGFDDAVAVESLPLNHTLRSAAAAVGLIRMVGDTGIFFSCTAFLIDDDLLLTAYHCVQGTSGFILTMADGAGAVQYSVSQSAVIADQELNFALLRVSENAGRRFGTIRLTDTAPSPGQGLAALYYRGAGRKLAVLSDECRVVQVDENNLHHLCDTGAGTSGAAIMSSDGQRLLGLHHRRGPLGGVATRADVIAVKIRELSSQK